MSINYFPSTTALEFLLSAVEAATPPIRRVNKVAHKLLYAVNMPEIAFLLVNIQKLCNMPLTILHTL